ncbi:hypothetical protein E2C01_046698 [Portunus trituberculatus]|uniref:Uncharacterized protein n=1 Tax=Portunus trituberculatus TaxID=210409 RepID=A0A5B7FZ92_PORTR|nr:hypothetical protein [Portunus trituberculatus]
MARRGQDAAPRPHLALAGEVGGLRGRACRFMRVQRSLSPGRGSGPPTGPGAPPARPPARPPTQPCTARLATPLSSGCAIVSWRPRYGGRGVADGTTRNTRRPQLPLHHSHSRSTPTSPLEHHCSSAPGLAGVPPPPAAVMKARLWSASTGPPSPTLSQPTPPRPSSPVRVPQAPSQPVVGRMSDGAAGRPWLYEATRSPSEAAAPYTP